MGPEWIYSQKFNFEPRPGGELKIFGFYNNKEKRKKKTRTRKNQK